MISRNNSSTLISYTKKGAVLGATLGFGFGFGYNAGVTEALKSTDPISLGYRYPINSNLKIGFDTAVTGVIVGACIGGTVAMAKIAATSACRFFNNKRQQVNEHKEENNLEINRSNNI